MIEHLTGFRFPYTQPSVYDEHVETVLDLTGAMAQKVNECVDAVNSAIGETTVASPTISAPLRGKKIAIFGDSIVYGSNGFTRVEKSWPAILQEISGAEIKVQGVDPSMVPVEVIGTTLAIGNGWNWEDSYAARAMVGHVDSFDFTGYDMVIVAYGTNDYGYGIEMGSDSDVDKTSFKGGLNYIINTLNVKYPKLEIVFLTPMYAATSLTMSLANLCMMDYVVAIRHICGLKGIRCIDLHTSMGINGTNWQAFYGDLLHPNQTTYYMMANFIYKGLLNSSAGINGREVRDSGIVNGGGNLIPRFAVESNVGGIFADSVKEQGFVLKCDPNTVMGTINFLYVRQLETLYLTFWEKSTAPHQYYEIDLTDGVEIIARRRLYAEAGEEFIKTTLEIPASANPYTPHQIRIATVIGNTAPIYVTSMMLCRGAYRAYERALVDTPFVDIALDADNAVGPVTPQVRKRSDGYVDFQGIVLVNDAAGKIATLPAKYAPLNGFVAPIVSNDGTPTFITGGTNGDLIVGIANKYYDLSSLQYLSALPQL